ncbi:MAG: hypothetical protein ISS82_05210 [Nanoarchaeota archaeon]|nr:hypothetical protein [Nanoarchaeota archaeon]
MKKKSQTAIEFLVFVFLAIVILMMYLTISSNFLNITLKNKDNTLARDLVLELKNEINLAGLSKNNYQKEFTLPETINNKTYTIAITEGARELTIRLEGNDFTEPLATKIDTYTEIQPGNIILIKKEEDQITIQRQ